MTKIVFDIPIRENSNYSQSIFPAGEVYVRLSLEVQKLIRTRISNPPNPKITAHQINLHGASSDDIMTLLLLVDALRQVDDSIPINLYAPYLPYGRQDRVCTHGESLSLKVFADILNSCNFNEVITEDPHSSAINPIIDKLIVEQPIDFYSDTIADIIGINSPLDYDGKFECIVVSPDTSAYKRVQRFVELITNWFKMSQPSMVIGAKTRGVGEEIQIKLLHGSINPNATDIILIDDICDGGRTFIEMARKLREDKILTNHNLHLVVTHGIFSNGMEVIHQEFKTVYVKNLVVSNKSSFRDVKGVSQISQFRKGVDPNELYWKSEKI